MIISHMRQNESDSTSDMTERVGGGGAPFFLGAALGAAAAPESPLAPESVSRSGYRPAKLGGLDCRRPPTRARH
eukprot:5039086-Prymnesium_polylepis.1